MTSSDHNIIEPGPGKAGAPMRRAAFFVILCGVGIALAAVASEQGWIQRFGLSQENTDFVLGIASGMLFAIAVLLFWKAKIQEREARDGPSRIDDFQSRQYRVLVAVTLITAAIGGAAILHPLRHGGMIETALSVEFPLLAIALAAAAAFGVGFVQPRYRRAANDELVRMLRGRAVQLGYLLTVAGLGVVSLVELVRPDLMAVALPTLLLAGVLVPAVYLIVAERRASGNG